MKNHHTSHLPVSNLPQNWIRTIRIFREDAILGAIAGNKIARCTRRVAEAHASYLFSAPGFQDRGEVSLRALPAASWLISVSQ